MPTSPATNDRRRGRAGFALLELLTALLMLTVAILAIGQSAFSLLRLERDLLADTAVWRTARSALALHLASRPPAEIDAYLAAAGWTRAQPGSDPLLGLPTDGWALWVLQTASAPPRSFRAAVFPLPLPPPKPATPPAR